ncbi:MAG: PP2C family protein-serine/threonine phosphatase [Thermoleophilia bacterium]
MLGCYRLCARCCPVRPGELVGGDWYDVEHLGDGHLAFSVGDVVGHGVAAAAAMSELRRTVRTLVPRDPSPLRVLGRLNRAARETPNAFCATIVYGVLDAEGNGELVRAGHPPPLLWREGFLPDLLLTPANPPLGTGLDFPLERQHFTLPIGGRMLLFSDGLVERAASDVDQDLARLVDVVVRLAPSLELEPFCDALIAQMASDETDDDVTVLCIERVATTVRGQVARRRGAAPDRRGGLEAAADGPTSARTRRPKAGDSNP